MLNDLEAKAAAGTALTRDEADRVMACPDLVSVGVLAESARRARHKDRVTYGQVLCVDADTPPEALGDARELRITRRPASIDEACALVQTMVEVAGEVPVTGFSAADLVTLAGRDLLVLADLAVRLKSAGLTSVAFLSVDQFDDEAALVDAVKALTHCGLQVPRASVERAASVEDRLRCIERVARLASETGVLRTFAPLPRVDESETPSSGYDDVRTVAVARLMCAQVPSIQVDWQLYGPKLAQVAIAYGADDIDNVPAIDALGLGHRRSPGEDIARQIKAAFASPVARDGRFQQVS